MNLREVPLCPYLIQVQHYRVFFYRTDGSVGDFATRRSPNIYEFLRGRDCSHPRHTAVAAESPKASTRNVIQIEHIKLPGRVYQIDDPFPR